MLLGEEGSNLIPFFLGTAALRSYIVTLGVENELHSYLINQNQLLFLKCFSTFLFCSMQMPLRKTVAFILLC